MSTAPIHLAGKARRETEWLSVAEVAKHTGFHPQTVLEALWSGELRGFQRTKGARWRIRPEDADAWVKGEPPTLMAVS